MTETDAKRFFVGQEVVFRSAVTGLECRSIVTDVQYHEPIGFISKEDGGWYVLAKSLDSEQLFYCIKPFTLCSLNQATIEGLCS